jgi:hypothetical protein
MTRITRTLVLLLAAAPVLLGMSWDDGIRGDGVEATTERPLEAFRRVSVSGAIELRIERGSLAPAHLSADANLLEHIRLEQDGDRLRIYTQGSLSPRLPLRVVLRCEQLEEVEASGACTVRLEDLDDSELRLQASGASRIEGEGRVDELQVRLSGASKLQAQELQARAADVRLSGASKGLIAVAEQLDAECSGASKLEFWGRPTRTHFSSSGASKITAHEGDYRFDDELESRPRERESKVL